MMQRFFNCLLFFFIPSYFYFYTIVQRGSRGSTFPAGCTYTHGHPQFCGRVLNGLTFFAAAMRPLMLCRKKNNREVISVRVVNSNPQRFLIWEKRKPTASLCNQWRHLLYFFTFSLFFKRKSSNWFIKLRTFYEFGIQFSPIPKRIVLVLLPVYDPTSSSSNLSTPETK